MTELRYMAREWDVAGRRHLVLKVNMAVMPYVRQTRNSRHRKDAVGERVREYNDSQGNIRDVVRLILLQEGIEPFGKERLGFASWFWLCPKKVFKRDRYVTQDNPKACDLGNLEKAIEDVFNGAVYPDDRQIWVRERGFKEKSAEDWFAVHVWQVADDELVSVEDWGL